MNRKLFVIDGNNYIHRAYHALPPLTTAEGKPVGALYGFVRMVFSIAKKESPDYIAVLFDTPAPTFRHKLFKPYKATRPPADDALVFQLSKSREIAQDMGLKVISREGFEADDLAATIAEKFRGEVSVYLVTGDKDILQIVDDDIFVYNEMKKEIINAEKVRSRYGVPPRAFADYLALAGDSSDNIPGARGIGPKTASRLLSKYGSIIKIYENLEEIPSSTRKKLEESREDVFLSLRLARLDRNVEMDLRLEDLKYDFSEDILKKIALKWEFRSLFSQAPREDQPPAENAEFVENISAFAGEKMIGVRFASSAAFDGIFIATGEKCFFAETSQGELGFFGSALGDFLDFVSNKDLTVVTDDAKKFHKLLISEKRHPLCAIKDVSLMGYVLDSARNQDFFSLLSKHMKMKIPPSSDFKEQARATSRIFALAEVLEKKTAEAGNYELYKNIELPLAEVLAQMEIWGIKIDAKVLNEISSRMGEEAEILAKKIFAAAGEEFNINSPKQLQRILYEKLGLPSGKKTKTGSSVDSAALSEIAHLNPICGEIIRYRNLTKLKSTYADALPALISSDGRLHTNFNSTGTATGRLSSSSPNLQNIPARGDFAAEIRSAFVPEDGMVFISADYSQIDLRVLAHFSSDERLLEAFRSGEDIHSFTASQIFAVGKNEITKEMRRVAKTVNFGIVYGMSSWGLARGLGIDKKEAADIIKNYWKNFPGVKNFIDKITEETFRRGFSETLMRRKRPIWGRNSASARLAINTPVQGTSSDIIKKAMVEIFPILGRFSAKMILQIHDELLFEAPIAEASGFAEKAKEIMENCVTLSVPIKVNLKKGGNFSNLKDVL
ncbi:MAG: DNA polymerase I [Elusimicrobia bacterium]|nr:DNA polymerase I [Elusimicrobiota bacterium]